MRFIKLPTILLNISTFKLHKLIQGTPGQLVDSRESIDALHVGHNTYATANTIPDRFKIFASAQGIKLISVQKNADIQQIQDQLRSYQSDTKKESEPKSFSSSLSKSKHP